MNEPRDINLYNVEKVVVYVTSDDTGEEIPIMLSLVGCIPEEPGTVSKSVCSIESYGNPTEVNSFNL